MEKLIVLDRIWQQTSYDTPNQRQKNRKNQIDSILYTLSWRVMFIDWPEKLMCYADSNQITKSHKGKEKIAVEEKNRFARICWIRSGWYVLWCFKQQFWVNTRPHTSAYYRQVPKSNHQHQKLKKKRKKKWREKATTTSDNNQNLFLSIWLRHRRRRCVVLFHLCFACIRRTQWASFHRPIPFFFCISFLSPATMIRWNSWKKRRTLTHARWNVLGSSLAQNEPNTINERNVSAAVEKKTKIYSTQATVTTAIAKWTCFLCLAAEKKYYIHFPHDSQVAKRMNERVHEEDNNQAPYVFWAWWHSGAMQLLLTGWRVWFVHISRWMIVLSLRAARWAHWWCRRRRRRRHYRHRPRCRLGWCEKYSIKAHPVKSHLVSKYIRLFFFHLLLLRQLGSMPSFLLILVDFVCRNIATENG